MLIIHIFSIHFLAKRVPYFCFIPCFSAGSKVAILDQLAQKAEYSHEI